MKTILLAINRELLATMKWSTFMKKRN